MPEDDPRLAEALFVRGNAHELEQDLPDAIADYESALKVAPPNWRHRSSVEECLRKAEAELAQGPPPGWVRKASEAGSALQRGDYEGARPLFEATLAEAGADAEGQERFRPALAMAHYNLACIYSLLSAGKSSPTAAPQPVDPAKARELADRAFAHLRKSLDLGFSDLPHLDAAPDLAPLRVDPRWESLHRQDAK